MRAILKFAGVGIVGFGICLASVETASAVLAEGAASPVEAPPVPYAPGPSYGFEPIFRYADAPANNTVPEPSTLLLGAAAALGLQAMNARQRRRSR